MKPYSQMTPAERTADRIARNKANREAVAPVVRFQKRVAEVRNACKVNSLLKEFYNALPTDLQNDFVRFLQERAK